MARIRTIKPEFPQSETIGSLSRDARLLFIQLWTIADDAGRCRSSSRMLASLLYPYDDDAATLMESWLRELERGACIVRYRSNDSQYLEITNWAKHQKIDRPSASRIPPASDCIQTIIEVSENPREGSCEDLGPRTRTGTKDLGSSSSLRSDARQLRLIETTDPNPSRQNLKPERQISTDPKTDFYRRGEELLGKNQGGFLRKVLTAKEDNISLARAALEMAATKPDPKRYLGGVINSNREIHSNQHLRDSGAAW